VLLNTSADSEARTLTIIGAAVTMTVAAVAGLIVVFNPFASDEKNVLSVAIDTPYVGQGVSMGTALIMHGVKVGEVTAVSRLPQGGVRLDTELQRVPVAGLTDTMNIDFRPVNYFGVTGINLMPNAGGQALRNGMRIATVPTGNFTLQTLLSRLGAVSSASLTPQLINVIDRATRYTDALDPLIETVVLSANALVKVQTVSTSQLLTNATGLSVALPSISDASLDALDRLDHSGLDTMTEDFYRNRVLLSTDLGTKALFDRFGTLEGKHMTELLPFIDLAMALTSIAPGLIRPDAIGQELTDLRTRFEALYGGAPGQRAVQVHIVLDSLPGVAAPVAAIGGP
jgi:phospholipid/cholesterol/gamma-HCH transport system substrate-binding protein